MRKRTAYRAHIAALVTIVIWGTTFVSTKLLLQDFQPVEILFCRFLIGYLFLWIICPHRYGKRPGKQEGIFMAAGLCGICLYYLLENIALTYTLASNVGVIVSVSPFLTAILARFFTKPRTRLPLRFLIGFLAAMTGIGLISLSGNSVRISVAGDLLALGAAFVWACYSLLSETMDSFGLPLIPATRRTFFYGLLFMLPVLFASHPQWDLQHLADKGILLNMLYLSLGASALCFLTWNYAVKILGPVSTSIYLYLVPAVTVVTSMLILKESLTVPAVSGIVLTVAGLFLSGKSGGKYPDRHQPAD